MITYTFLQQYWWLLVSLLGGLLVFLMFVQGANSLIFSLTNDETERTMIVSGPNSSIVNPSVSSSARCSRSVSISCALSVST